MKKLRKNPLQARPKRGAAFSDASNRRSTTWFDVIEDNEI